MPTLLSLLDVPDESVPDARPSAAPPRTLDALKRVLLRESQSCFWSSKTCTGSIETQALLDSLVDSVGRPPAAPGQPPVRVSRRPSSKTFYTQLRWSPCLR